MTHLDNLALEQWAEGGYDPDSPTAAHLEGCALCQDALERLEAGWAEAGQGEVPSMAFSMDSAYLGGNEARLQMAIADSKTPKQPWWRAQLRWLLAPGLAATAGLALYVAGPVDSGAQTAVTWTIEGEAMTARGGEIASVSPDSGAATILPGQTARLEITPAASGVAYLLELREGHLYPFAGAPEGGVPVIAGEPFSLPRESERPWRINGDPGMIELGLFIAPLPMNEGELRALLPEAKASGEADAAWSSLEARYPGRVSAIRLALVE